MGFKRVKFEVNLERYELVLVLKWIIIVVKAIKIFFFRGGRRRVNRIDFKWRFCFNFEVIWLIYECFDWVKSKGWGDRHNKWFKWIKSFDFKVDNLENNLEWRLRKF